MAKKEVQEIPQTALQTLEQKREWRGTEKRVVKMTDGQQIVAAKIYFERDLVTNRQVNQAAKARAEFRAYQYFSRTPIGIFIPPPLYLLNDEQGNVVGLAVEWKTGHTLSREYPGKPLKDETITDLEDRLLALNRKGSLPDQDMYCEANLLYDSSSPHQLWFAECHYETSKYRKVYDQDVKAEMDYLREYYMS
jgi:hypothetical protein